MTWPRMDGRRTLELGLPGAQRQDLTALVLGGGKVGTAGLLTSDYEQEGEELESVGERLVLVGDDGTRLGIIEVTDIQVVPFDEVTDEFARSEGEGYDGWSQWAVAHRGYWEKLGQTIDAETPVVCTNFVFHPDQADERP